MTDFFFQMGLSNACISLALGIVAMVVGAKARRPHLAHMLWLLVFVKLVTPPMLKIPIVTIPVGGETAVVINDNSRAGPMLSNSRQLNVDEQSDATVWPKLKSSVWNHARVWLPPIWLLGSVVVFCFSMVRVCRFSRMLAAESEAAPLELQTEAEKIARRLGLKTIPTIYTTSARISPMVWWTGGKVRIVIPTALLEKMDAHEWQWVLAHEMAHVRRRDYMVRWLEWLACVFFWWNPVVWWAQRNLRAMEEICCDEMVISSLNPKPKFYADSLLSAVEYLACPVLRPPAMASEINSGGFLERRFKMIVSNKSKQSNSHWLQICVLLFAVVVLPFGIAAAQDYKAVERRLGEAVAKGELTLKQASVMMDALRKASGSKKEQDLERAQAYLKKAGGAEKGQDLDRAKAYLMKVKKELGELVEAGEISKEAATRRYEGAEKRVKERLAGQSERGQRSIAIEEYKRAEAKMRKMVEEGKAKPEDVERRLIEMRKMMARQTERQRSDERGDRERPDWEGIKRRIEGAVKSGKMTREQADVKYKEIEEKLSREDRRGDKRAEYEGFERRIKAAVEAGRMTREEAKEKLEDYKKRIGR
ncbi:MAG: M56 family metallopeptidase [Planctomycetota bacterium]|jgi:beta-lactamase regulating signal transducer with metallopeptidase domain